MEDSSRTTTVVDVLNLNLDEPTSHEPPTNDEGIYVCGRACVDESVCMARVSVPFWPCPIHDIDDPFVS